MDELTKKLQSTLDQLSDIAQRLAEMIQSDLKGKIPYQTKVWHDTYSFFNIVVLDVADPDRGVVETFFEVYKIDGIDLCPMIKSPEITDKYFAEYRHE
jgi:hypothetical protein